MKGLDRAENLKKLTIAREAVLLDALKKIDSNKKKFLIVTDGDNHALGTLTDGDIRRALIAGASLDDSIDGRYTSESKMLKNIDSFADAVYLFRSEKISFIPIVDTDGVLLNVITKDNFHTLVLQDASIDLNHDFLGIDDSLVYFEIHYRPWGFYKTTVLNDLFQAKVLSVNPGATLSLQYHMRREEYWVIVNGQGKINLDGSVRAVSAGDTYYIPKECRHRLSNTSSTENLLVVEVQLGDYFGEDDIVRIEDVYGR